MHQNLRDIVDEYQVLVADLPVPHSVSFDFLLPRVEYFSFTSSNIRLSHSLHDSGPLLQEMGLSGRIRLMPGPL